jgi:hypothetical protein
MHSWYLRRYPVIVEVPASYTATVSGPGETIYQFVDATFTVSTDVPSPTYTWSVSGGSVVSGQGTTSAVIRFTSSGSQSVTCDVTGGGTASASWSGTVTAFNPLAVSGLTLWLDASDAATLTLDESNNVSQWNDKSGNARHLTQATPTIRPTLITASINGLSTVRTDGTDDRISSTTYPSTTWYGAGKNQITIITLLKRVVNSGRWIHGLVTSINGYGERFLFDRQPPGVGTQDLIVESNSGVSTLSAAPDIATSLSIDSVTWQSGNTYTLRRYISGSATSYSSVSALGGTMESGQLYTLGFNNHRASVDFAEIMIYSRVLTTAELSAVESYLVGKWGTI